MIVKIQRSQPPTQSGLVLIYNKPRDIFWQGKIDAATDKWMGDEQKRFAVAHTEGSEIVIDRSAPWQEW